MVLDLIEERRVSLAPGDTLILFSGANDVSHTSWNAIRSTYEEILTKYHFCRVGVVLIPLRRGSHHLNTQISHINQKLIKFLTPKQVLIFNPQSILGNEDYAPDGLHMNKKGKEKICDLLKSQLVVTSDVDAAAGTGRRCWNDRSWRGGLKRSNNRGLKRSNNNRAGRRSGDNHGRVYYNSTYSRPFHSDSDSNSDYYQWSRGRYCDDYGYDDYDCYYHYQPYMTEPGVRPGRANRRFF
ncbi:uncharacterized protein LOC113471416 [Diaphorina citri]|uniref:Uncharacterized protein LOC113471416 n=1 Tax=Diaphorina citri TaxID=121845 RepID=A0A3Q0JD39_DIACI|nr:uncharacterized protein LOC113471416 [Diaphorina citri]